MFKSTTSTIAGRLFLAVAAAVVFNLSLATRASATELDCTASCNLVSYAGALWATVDTQSTGTGVINSFVRISGAPETAVDGHNTGGAAIPVSLAVCQTNSATGQCISALGSTVATPISGGETPTFAIFVGGHGEVAFDPGVSRVFVRFTTDSGEIVGATSVAVRTR